MKFYAEANLNYGESHTTEKHNFIIQSGPRTPSWKTF